MALRRPYDALAMGAPDPERRPLLAPGTEIAGYRILDLLGRGGMGEVYRALQLSLDRVVALKILAPHLARRDPAFARRFVEEARAAGRFNNPNIIHVHDVGQAPAPPDSGSHEMDAIHFISMEFVDGESLHELLRREGCCGSHLVARVMQGMARALVYAQEMGIVHRDIKPDNIMLGKDGSVKLADLGLAMQASLVAESSTRDAHGRAKVMGTPLYMSPQQARGLPLDHRSDQYSLGATLFHMLTGRPPYQGEGRTVMQAHVRDPIPDPTVSRPDVPEAWRQLCRRLLAKEPGQRFDDGLQLAAAVEAAANGLTLEHLDRLARRRPGRLRAALAAGGAALIVILILVAVRHRTVPPPPTPALPLPALPPPASAVAAAPAATAAAQPAVRPSQPTPVPPAWPLLRERLEPLRTSLDYLKIRAVVDAWRRETGASDPAALAILDLGMLAAKGEVAVRSAILGDTPVVEVTTPGGRQEWRLVRLSLGEVVWRDPHDRDGGERRSARHQAPLPWPHLLNRALEDQGPSEEIEAATLWMWRQPEAGAAIRLIADRPLGVALRRLDGQE